MTRDVVYPVFLNCCQHVVDNYWEDVFTELAYNNAPYGSYIHNMIFNCKAKNGAMISVIIDENNIQKTHDDIYTIIRDNLNISSPLERIQTQHEFNRTEEELKNNRNKWSDIKKKNIKDVLIDMFVIEMKTTYNLLLCQARILRSIIHTGILFKAIDGDDITMEYGKITSINGITFGNKIINNELDMYNTETTNQANNSDNQTRESMSKLWDKYVSDLEQKKIDYNT
jgi:hypothetical protein